MIIRAWIILLLLIALSTLDSGPYLTGPEEEVRRPEFRIGAAGNEYAEILLPLSGPLEVTGIEISPPALLNRSIPSRYQAVWRVVDPRDRGGAGRLPPGTLIPLRDPFYGEKRRAFPLPIPAGQVRLCLIEFFVPPGTVPGNYNGTIGIVAREGLLEPKRYQLSVRDFSLDPSPPFPVLIGLEGREILARHFGPAAPAHQEEELQLAQLYLDRALMNRASLPGILSADWRLADCPVDWDEFDRTWSRYLEGRDIPGGLARARVTGIALPPVPAGRDQSEFWGECCAHFRDRDWFGRLGWWRGTGSLHRARLVDPDLPVWDKFLLPAWGPGGCFVPGRPEDIGGTQPIPLDTLLARFLRGQVEREQVRRRLAGVARASSMCPPFPWGGAILSGPRRFFLAPVPARQVFFPGWSQVAFLLADGFLRVRACAA